LHFYFQRDYEEVVKDFKLAEVLNYKLNLTNNIASFEVTNQTNDETLDFLFYRIKTIEEVKFEFNQKAIFVEQNGCIIFTLSTITLIYRVDVKPFIFDSLIWNHLKCEGLFVHISHDKINWQFVDTLYFNNKNLHNTATIEVQNCEVLYIRIMCGRFKSSFAISHVGLHKYKN